MDHALHMVAHKLMKLGLVGVQEGASLVLFIHASKPRDLDFL